MMMDIDEALAIPRQFDEKLYEIAKCIIILINKIIYLK